MFIEPMYACPVPNLVKNPRAKPVDLESGMWVAEEKYDGIRVVTEISSTKDRLFVDKGITAWSRYGNLKPHPEHIEEELAKFPDSYIDGERLAIGKRSYGSLDEDNRDDLVLFVFDILRRDDNEYHQLPYKSRREILEQIFEEVKPGPAVQLASATTVHSWEEVYGIRDAVYARDGEGLILKRIDTPYTFGKRPKRTWIKIKQLECTPFTVIGFQASRGLIDDRGPYGMTQLVDDEGNETQVKTKNNVELRKLEAEGANLAPGQRHPAIGRTLWCEWQERTPDASYRHIRWNHWEGE